MKKILIILGFPLWFPLLIAAFAIFISLCITAFALVISLWAVFIAVLLSSLAVLIWSAALCLNGNGVVGLAAIGAGFAIFGVSLLFFVISRMATKGAAVFAGKVLSKTRGI